MATKKQQLDTQVTKAKKKIEDKEQKKDIAITDNSNDKVTKEKKITTTKKILIVAWTLLIVLIFLDIIGIEVDNSLQMIGGIVTAIISSVYMWKAKAENKVKISYSMVDDLADKYGINNVIELLHDILND